MPEWWLPIPGFMSTCADADCPSRDALERHLNRTELQVQLLTPTAAGVGEDEALF